LVSTGQHWIRELNACDDVPAGIEIEVRVISQQKSACDNRTPTLTASRREYHRLAVLIKNLDSDGLELQEVARRNAVRGG
jgi:hypothetical protein